MNPEFLSTPVAAVTICLPNGRWSELLDDCGWSTYEEIAHGDGAVGVDNEAVSTQRRRVLELGRYEHTDGSQQLQLRPPDSQYRENTVEVVDGQRKHFILALLFSTYLHQPVTHWIHRQPSLIRSGVNFISEEHKSKELNLHVQRKTDKSNPCTHIQMIPCDTQRG